MTWQCHKITKSRLKIILSLEGFWRMKSGRIHSSSVTWKFMSHSSPPSPSLPTAVTFMYSLMLWYLIMQIMISFTLVGLFMSSGLQSWHCALRSTPGFSNEGSFSIYRIMKEHLCYYTSSFKYRFHRVIKKRKSEQLHIAYLSLHAHVKWKLH